LARQEILVEILDLDIMTEKGLEEWEIEMYMYDDGGTGRH
jgi:hypothetical protein